MLVDGYVNFWLYVFVDTTKTLARGEGLTILWKTEKWAKILYFEKNEQINKFIIFLCILETFFVLP